MIRIHYRPLANRRAYESIVLPVPPRITRSYAVVPMPPGPERDALRASAKQISFRPDPLGDAVARGAVRAFDVPSPSARDSAYDPPKTDAEFRDRLRGLRPPTTREIPIAVDATLPAISTALERLRGELAAMGLAHQAARARSIGLAVARCGDLLRKPGGTRTVLDA